MFWLCSSVLFSSCYSPPPLLLLALTRFQDPGLASFPAFPPSVFFVISDQGGGGSVNFLSGACSGHYENTGPCPLLNLLFSQPRIYSQTKCPPNEDQWELGEDEGSCRGWSAGFVAKGAGVILGSSQRCHGGAVTVFALDRNVGPLQTPFEDSRQIKESIPSHSAELNCGTPSHKEAVVAAILDGFQRGF